MATLINSLNELFKLLQMNMLKSNGGFGEFYF